MPHEQKKNRNRAAFFIFLVVAQILLVAAIWQYHQVLVTVYDDALGRWFSFGGHEEGDRRGLPRIALWVPEFPDATRETLQAVVLDWRQYLARHDLRVSELNTIDDKEDLLRYRVLIVPGGFPLAETDIDAIKFYLESGRGVFMLSATGFTDADGNWRGDQVLRHIAGGIATPFTPSSTNEHAQAHLALAAGTPLDIGLPPGFTLALHPYDPPFQLRLLDPRAQTGGFWRNESVDDASKEGAMPSAVALEHQGVGLVYGEYLSGRYVWSGFSLNARDNQPRQEQAFDRLLRNTFAYLGRQVRAFTPSWPHGAHSAFSLGLCVAHPSEIRRDLLELLQLHDLPVTLFIDAEALTQHPDAWRELALVGEVALWDRAPAPAQSVRAEARRLRALKKRMQQISGQSTIGYRAAGGDAAEATLDAVVRAGFAYVSSTRTDRPIPEIIRTYRPIRFVTRERELWLLPEQPGAQDLDAASRACEALHATGGLFSMVVRPSDAETVWADWLHYAARGGRERRIWFAPLGDVSTHWRVWGNVRVDVAYPSARRIRLRLSNTGQHTVEQVYFYLELDQPLESLDLQPSTLGSPLLQTSTTDGLQWRLHLSRLPPGKNYEYRLEL